MKKRKQWIAMLFMLAMLLTVMPLAAFAEGENPAPQGNEWTGEWDDMQVNVLFGLGNDDIGAEIYKSERWENAPKNLTPEELTALKDFYDNPGNGEHHSSPQERNVSQGNSPFSLC